MSVILPCETCFVIVFHQFCGRFDQKFAVLLGMGKGEREHLQSRIVHFYLNHANQEKSKTVEHFSNEGIPRRTIYSVIQKFNKFGHIGDLPRSGRPVTVSTEKTKSKVRKMFEGKDRISTRMAAAKLNISQSSVARIKLRQLGIRSFVKQKAPKYTDRQMDRAKKGAHHVYRKIIPSGGGKILIMDDESYFPKDPSQVAGRQYYHTANKNSIDRNLKVKPKMKFAEKYLVWQAISSDGKRSEPFILDRQAMNQDVYLKDCIEKRLIPFIRKYYSTDAVIFWPDLASAHYANRVLERLEQEGVEVIAKKKNPPNLPQARGIERYWALVKAEYQKRIEPPKHLAGFKRMYQNDAAKVSEQSVQKVMKSSVAKLRKIGYSGPYSVY